jgi:hypothetical protein
LPVRKARLTEVDVADEDAIRAGVQCVHAEVPADTVADDGRRLDGLDRDVLREYCRDVEASDQNVGCVFEPDSPGTVVGGGTALSDTQLQVVDGEEGRTIHNKTKVCRGNSMCKGIRNMHNCVATQGYGTITRSCGYSVGLPQATGTALTRQCRPAAEHHTAQPCTTQNSALRYAHSTPQGSAAQLSWHCDVPALRMLTSSTQL